MIPAPPELARASLWPARMSRTSLLALSLALAALPAGRAAAQRCDAPRVLLTVDKSSSMLGTLPGGGTKWDAARMAIGELTGAYADRIDFGLQPFPYPNRCEPGLVTLDVAANTPEAIMEALGAPPPSGGSYTPMAQTLDVAAAYAPLLDASRDNHLVLITDGWQWCDPHDPATRFTPVESVRRLREAGVTVHVIGFGAGVDSLTLNRAAVAAGTALPGCDATLSDPAAPNHCYSQANDLLELRAALEAIARSITDEACDGWDNDCDGLVDEGFDVDADGYTTCGSDPTSPGTPPDPTAADCDDAEARVHPGAAEVCDALDNDCDGVVDPGCSCVDGDARPCGSDVGACTPGTQTCEGGTWGSCDGTVDPVAELCNAVDDDCDGEVDEDADASCAEGEVCTADGCLPLTPPEPDPVDPMTDEPEDGGFEPAPMDGGCACAAAGSPRGPAEGAALLSLLALGALLLRRRR